MLFWHAGKKAFIKNAIKAACASQAVLGMGDEDGEIHGADDGGRQAALLNALGVKQQPKEKEYVMVDMAKELAELNLLVCVGQLFVLLA